MGMGKLYVATNVLYTETVFNKPPSTKLRALEK